ncbi:uncharacterized protein ACN427_001611 isoform 2-T11 [Glossina fuscipes fuscipes]
MSIRRSVDNTPGNFKGVKQNSVSSANRYAPAVLVGSWFEERCSGETDPKAITPGIYGKSTCAEDFSLYKTHFTRPIPENSRKGAMDFVNWKQEGFSNRVGTEVTNIKFSDGVEFYKNATTMTDMMFRILPQQTGEASSTYTLRGYGKPKIDMLRSYGNLTKTGLLKWRACEQWREKNIPVDVSHYKQNFKRIEVKPDPHRRVKASSKSIP